jgi:hypothetical protein
MKKIIFFFCTGLVSLGWWTGCRPSLAPLPQETEILHQNMYNLTQVIIYDVFTPPVATRIYAYASLASYEAIRWEDSSAGSLAAKLRGFPAISGPDKGKSYDFGLAASKAFYTTIHKMIFSQDTLSKAEEIIYGQYRRSLDPGTYQRSLDFGESVAREILVRAMTDGYVKSRGKPKFLGSHDPGKWRPTPPDYLDGVEWCWNTMQTLVLDSASQFMPPRPPEYSLDHNSAFFKGVKEVYDISKTLTEEQKTIARFWDDNPFVIEHSGHMMFGNKKITPGGHWMGIAGIASRSSGAGAVKTARAYALTAIALFDAFISCWDEKYRSNVVRPVTVINEQIDPQWTPFLQTPPFPEYTSGHSTITASASTVLSALFGDHFAYQDTSDLHYIGMQRHFNSFKEAAAEASFSRLLGGIHYRTGIDAGADQGKKVGALVVQKLIAGNP